MLPARERSEPPTTPLSSVGLVHRMCGLFGAVPSAWYLFSILRKLKKEHFENTLPEEESSFIVTPKNKEIFYRKTREMLENTSKSMDIITTSKRFNYIGALFEEAFTRALERGVKFRIITDLYENENPQSKGLKALLQHPLFEVRYIPSKVPTPTWQADNLRMFIETSIVTSPSSVVSTFWTNNPQILAGFHNYFILLWNTSSRDAPVKASLPLSQ